MAESEKSVHEYRFQRTVEGRSEGRADITVSLPAGINQLQVTAESRTGEILGSRRIGLDVTSSDAELIIGLLSDHPESLSWLGGVGINDGLLRTRTVVLDGARLPADETDLDQLDVLVISDFYMRRIRETEAEVLKRWTSRGGVLMIGTGGAGETALAPYFSGLLKNALAPEERSFSMDSDFREDMPDSMEVQLPVSAVYLKGGREVLFSGMLPVVSTVTEGAGLIAVAGYDFCDLQRYATNQSSYVDRLFRAILGQSRLDSLSVAASEQSLRQYWDVQELMNRSEKHAEPRLPSYAAVLLCYMLLVGPGIYFFLSSRGLQAYYRPAVILLALPATFLVWFMGLGTRFNGPVLTYARRLTISESSIDERDFINLRSPYGKDLGLGIRTEYYVYPVLKGSDYNGDITALLDKKDTFRTTVNYGRGQTDVRIEDPEPFSSAYFELDNKMPNSGGSFTSAL